MLKSKRDDASARAADALWMALWLESQERAAGHPNALGSEKYREQEAHWQRVAEAAEEGEFHALRGEIVLIHRRG